MSINLSGSQLKILALFTLRASGGVMPETSLCDVLLRCDVNTLMLSEAVGDLTENGHILRYVDNDDSFLKISDTGNVIVDELKKDVPVTVREKAAEAVVAEMMRLRGQISVSCSVDEVPDGYSVNAAFADDGTVLFRFSLYTPTKFQADLVARSFNTSPAETYKKIIDVLTSAEE